MEKNTLLELMIHEISEIERLIEAFKGKETISGPFINLARNKVRNLLEELDLLEDLSESETKKKEGTSSGIKEVSAGLPDNSQTTVTEQEPSAIQEIPAANETQAIEKTPAAEDVQTVQEKPSEEEKPPMPKEDTIQAEKINEPVQKDNSQFGGDKNNSIKAGRGVLGETLGKNKSSFNDLIAKKTTAIASSRNLKATPVSDLHKAMGINDRFFYQRELFGGNASLLNQTVDQLNQMQTLADAKSFLKTNFNWDNDHETVVEFLELVERRFI